MHTIRVGVIRGGISDEYDVSLKTGGAVLRNLKAAIYEPVDVLIDRKGIWHMGGIPYTPERILRHLDVVFNALHGYYGEDGKVQTLLDAFRVPYTGSNAIASAMGMHKALAKQVFQMEGLATPYYALVRRGEDTAQTAHNLFRRFPQPSIIKPVDGGSSVGIAIARSFEEFHRALADHNHRGVEALVEEYHPGREVTCGVIDGFRGECHYALPPVEIIPPPASSFFDYEAKYGGATRELCPAPSLSDDEKRMVMEMAVRAHKAIGARHYSRSDFIISRRGIQILEINTLPGLTEHSLIPKSLAAVGCSLSDFLDHVVTLALQKK